MADTKPTWIGTMLNDRYRIESLLGRGGMSSVYKGLDNRLQRTVAIKMIHPHLSERPQFVRRFEQEAAAVARLRHPNILQVHDYNHDKGSYYMVLEYIPGQTLDDRLNSLKTANLRLPLAEVIHLMVPLCDAVAYAHDQGIYHRDLKPSNIIVNLLGQAILMDFGVAKIVGGQVHTETGATIGTASYMAPESVKGEAVDHRADLYSLGVILFEMAAGKPPYEGTSPLTVMLAHVNEPIPDIRLSSTNIPEVLVSILNRALAKNPADRFQSAVEMGNALRALGQQLTGQTSPQSIYSGSQPLSSGEYLDTMPVGGKPLTDTGSKEVVTQVQKRSPQERPAAAGQQPQTESKRTGSRFAWMAGGAVVLLFVVALIVAAVIFLPRLLVSPPSSEGMVEIPAGDYSIGLGVSAPQYKPVQDVSLDTYWLDRFEVTEAQYAAYLEDAGNNPPSSWVGGSFPTGQADHPVQGVTWEMANDYCKWAGKRLPTEAEWEVAARGKNGLLFPWGNDESAVTLPQGQSYSVGSVPANQSVFGLFDMAGNVWEWVDEPYGDIGDGQAVLRGGAHDFLKDMAYRLIGDPDVPTTYATAGFRCAADKVELVEDTALLVNEDFSDPGSGWPEVDEGNVLSGYHPPDFYHVQSGEPTHISVAYFGGSFDNVSVASDVFVDSTDTETGDFRYGLIVRRIGDQFYAFTVDPRSQSWSILKGTTAGPVTLAEEDITSLQGLTTADTLRVDASGASLSFSINGEVVAQISDADYQIGDVGFYVETFSEERAHIHFDSLSVRQLQAATAENIILQDNFADPASGWPEVAEGSVLSGYHPPDYYHVQSSEPNHVSTAYFDQELTDFSMEANIFVDSTNTETGDYYYGLSVRHEGDNFYAFMVSPRAGHWKVVKNSSAGPQILAEGDIDTLTAENEIDILRVDAAGADLLFHVNGRTIAHLEDSDYSSGEIGFIVETIDEERAHVHYDSLLVTQAEMNMVAAPTAVSAAPTPGETAPPTTISATAVPEATATPAGPVPSSEAMVMIPAGAYLVGFSDSLDLAEYWIDRFEVTNAQYAEFIQETGQEPPDYWEAANIPDENGTNPVESVTWQEAADYCNWLDKRLPTEAEWEAAARGPEGWLFPWGNVRTAVELPASGTYPVGSIAENRSFFGVFDMAGNVWEWVDDPYQAVPAGERVIRGGANNFQNDLVFRAVGDPESSNMFANAGIRCAASQVDLVPDALVLMQDDFADLNSGWFQARTPVGSYFYGYHPTDFYHVQVSDAEDCLTVYETENFDNFMAQIDIFIAATNTEVGQFRYGLLLRDNGSEFYAFTISPRDQTWQVLKGTAAGIELMDSGVGTSIQGGTQATRDRLFVVANGPQMSFFLNGGLVSTVVDADLISGHVGFIVQTLDETYAHTHYDDITVWQLPPNLVPIETAVTAQEYTVDSPICRGSVSEDNLLVSFESYTIVQGDTLSGISSRFGVTIDDILGANGRTIENASFIRAGASIIIPMPS